MVRIINGREYPDKLLEADLRHADLHCAKLLDADLRHADLRHADLRHADLRRANLRHADLSNANLSSADLWDADLYGAKLTGAVLEGVKWVKNICPAGDLVGYKKLRNDVICKLLIPAAAKRSNATTRKCRAEYVVVLQGEGTSFFDRKFKYVIGETVRPTEAFCEDRWCECAPGIHFFLTYNEAEDYYY